MQLLVRHSWSLVPEECGIDVYIPRPVVLPMNIQVMEKLQEAEKTTKEIEVLRDGYRPAARRGAVLFFVLSDLAAINPMYQYSLNSYLEVFDLSLRKSLPDSHLQKRLRNIINTLSLNIYHYACTGQQTPLHTQLMSFILVCTIMYMYVIKMETLETSSTESLDS